MDHQMDWEKEDWPLIVPVTDEGRKEVLTVWKDIAQLEYVHLMSNKVEALAALAKGINALYRMTSDYTSPESIQWSAATINYYNRVSYSFDEISYK